MNDLKEIADTRLVEASGEEMRLGDLWATGPAVVGWLRHYA